MSLDGNKYYFKLGDKSQVIVRLKNFLNRQNYIKTKNSNTYIFDEKFQASLTEYQIHWKLKQQDGSLNAEIYAHIGSKLTPEQKKEMAMEHLILLKLLDGIGLVPARFGLIEGIPNFIQNNVTPLHPMPKKSRIPPSNKKAVDEAVDSKLAILFGDERQKPIVTGASQTGMDGMGEHYVLENGLVYVLHIFGQTGNEFIDI